ncbi:MAG: hypothetical protein LBG67_04410 [Campylobacteraceae bacterium]|jgi:chromosomal replication initiation ATPase DnaA|nr:hypothetical protein [Campylobacteraceae bacterium]
MKKFLVLVFSLSVFFGFSGCDNSSSDPEKIAVSFFQNWFDGQIDLAMGTLYFNVSDSEKAELVENRAKSKIAEIAEHFEKDNKDPMVVSKGVKYSDDESRATVELEMSSKDEVKTEIVIVDLVKVNKEWKISYR